MSSDQGSGRSTDTTMLDAVGYLISGMGSDLIGNLTTADTTEAFDSVRHPRPGCYQDRLVWYGMDGHWFNDWLDGRTQKVKGGASSSDHPRSGPGVSRDHILTLTLLGESLYSSMCLNVVSKLVLLFFG